MPRIIKSRWTRATPPTVGFELDLEERRQRMEEQRRRAKAHLRRIAGTRTPLAGMVERIEPYGAFVDGPWGHGLVHVSQMARRFVNDPREVVKLGQVVRVWVLRLDAQERVQLTMIPPDQGQTFRPKEGDENLRQEVALSDSAGSSLSPSSVIRLTPTEEQLLTRHLRFYNQLARGERKPTTPAQQHFVAVCKGEVAAETEHEIAYKKHREREGGRNRTRG